MNPFKDCTPDDLIKSWYTKYGKKDPLVGGLEAKNLMKTPWEIGTLFSEKTSPEDVERLQSFVDDSRFVVIGVCSNVDGEFPKYKDWTPSLTALVRIKLNWDSSDEHYTNPQLKGKFRYGFWPIGPVQMGYLPRFYLYGIFSKDEIEKEKEEDAVISLTTDYTSTTWRTLVEVHNLGGAVEVKNEKGEWERVPRNEILDPCKDYRICPSKTDFELRVEACLEEIKKALRTYKLDLTGIDNSDYYTRWALYDKKDITSFGHTRGFSDWDLNLE